MKSFLFSFLQHTCLALVVLGFLLFLAELMMPGSILPFFDFYHWLAVWVLALIGSIVFGQAHLRWLVGLALVAVTALVLRWVADDVTSRWVFLVAFGGMVGCFAVGCIWSFPSHEA